MRYYAAKKYLLKSMAKGLGEEFVKYLRDMLVEKDTSDEFKALLLGIPSVEEIYDAGKYKTFDEAKVTQNKVKIFIAKRLENVFLELLKSNNNALKNAAIQYLAALGKYKNLVLEYYYNAQNMTEKEAAFKAITASSWNEKGAVIEDFYNRYKGYDAVLNKWFAIQMAAGSKEVLQNAKKLLKHHDFNLSTPSRAYALIRTLIHNPCVFNRADGAGYSFVADCIIKASEVNKNVTNRLLDAFFRYNNLSDEMEVKLNKAAMFMKERIKDEAIVEKINKKLRTP